MASSKSPKNCNSCKENLYDDNVRRLLFHKHPATFSLYEMAEGYDENAKTDIEKIQYDFRDGITDVEAEKRQDITAPFKFNMMLPYDDPINSYVHFNPKNKIIQEDNDKKLFNSIVKQDRIKNVEPLKEIDDVYVKWKRMKMKNIPAKEYIEEHSQDIDDLDAENKHDVPNDFKELHKNSENDNSDIEKEVKDNEEKSFLLNAIENIPCINKKASWAIKWINDEKSSFAQRLVAFACVEGIFFSGSFCAIYWLKERNLMPGLCLSNDFISRDEGLHCDFACLLYSMLKNKLDYEIIKEMISEVVEIETEFITDSLPCRLIGMNNELMREYIKFVADRLVRDLGYENIYNVKNPFSFMENISLEGKTNFFEERVSQYKKADVNNSFNISDDF